MSWWTRAWGQMSIRDSALPPWPVMLVSHRPSCRGRARARGRHLRRGRVPALHNAGLWLSWSVVPKPGLQFHLPWMFLSSSSSSL